MRQGIHIPLEVLTGEVADASARAPGETRAAKELYSSAETFAASESRLFQAAGAQRRTFFLETFGCQMNEHDSEKVAGVLLARGYKQVETPEAANLILYNTCSIREKAAQKVFSRLGVYRDALGQANGEPQKIGVLGCVAQQEGEKIFSRAPWVSLVCGSASYRNLPQMLARLEAEIGRAHV